MKLNIAMLGPAPRDEITRLIQRAGFRPCPASDPQAVVAARRAGEVDLALVVAERPGEVADSVSALLVADRRLPAVIACPADVFPEARPLLAVGVRGIVLLEEMAETLAPTLTAAHLGQICVPARASRAGLAPVAAALSFREKQVVGLLAMGLRNREIAERLCIAESTVKSHLSSAFHRLGVGSRREAVALIANPALGMGRGIMSFDIEPIANSVSEDAA
jgi:DNA-binding NarL/FixJ family response regulator